MSKIWTLHVDDIGEVTERLFIKGICLAMESEDVSGNPMFQRGADVVLYGHYIAKPMHSKSEHGARKVLVSSVTLSNYCGVCELLIKDAEGNHIVYNKINGLDAHALAHEYYREFELVRGLVDGVAHDTFEGAWRRLVDKYWEDNGMGDLDVLKRIVHQY